MIQINKTDNKTLLKCDCGNSLDMTDKVSEAKNRKKGYGSHRRMECKMCSSAIVFLANGDFVSTHAFHQT